MSAPFGRAADGLTRFFSSLRLAVLLLIVLAAVSVLGTFIPQGQEPQVYIQRYGASGYHRLKFLGLVDLYHSWAFRALTSMLALNLTVCSIRRLKGIYRRTFRPEREKTAEQIRALRLANELPAPGNADVIERALSERKYKVRRRGRFIYAAKGVAGPWGDMLTHLSILVVLVGALAGSLGFVGTVNVYEGDWTDQFYDWNAGRDEPLGFRLCVDKFALQYYPAQMKVSVRERESGRKVGVFKAREGEPFAVTGTDLVAVPEEVDTAKAAARLDVYNGRKLVGVYNTAEAEGGQLVPPFFPYTFDVDSVGTLSVKSIASTVRVEKDARTLARATVEVNSPMRFGGVSIYQAAYGRDPEGRYYTGLQIVRDPGVPLVWAGFALLLAGLVMSIFISHRQVWAYVAEDRIVIGGMTGKDWKRFMREYGGVIRVFMQEAEP